MVSFAPPIEPIIDGADLVPIDSRQAARAETLLSYAVAARRCLPVGERAFHHAP